MTVDGQEDPLSVKLIKSNTESVGPIWRNQGPASAPSRANFHARRTFLARDRIRRSFVDLSLA